MGTSAPKVAPSILSADFSYLGRAVEEADEGGAEWIHLDVMDGHFVPNLTFGPPVIRALRRVTKKPFDVHLMIEDPERSLEEYARAGADHITVHVEAVDHLHRAVESIRSLGIKAGVALNPATPLGCIEEIVEGIDLLLLMTVDPGFGGQKLIPSTIGKVQRARRLLDERGSRAELVVDGGVTAENAPKLVESGATVLVAGSSVFGSPLGVRRAIEALRPRG